MAAHQLGGEAISASAIGMILKTTEAIGVELEPLLAKSNISRFPTGRVSAASRSKFPTLYKDCMVSIREHVAASNGHRHLSFECAEILSACVIRCQRLDEVLTRTIKFVETLNGRCMGLRLEVCGKQVLLKMAPKETTGTTEEMICDFFEMCFYYKLFGWLIGEPLVGGSLRLAYPGLVEEKILGEVLGAPVLLKADETAIVFSKEMLKRPLVRTAHELGESLNKSPIELMALPSARKLSLILRGIFRRALEEKEPIPQVDEVAYQLGQSGPTLRRHLAKENTSFQALVDDCRMEKAKELLENPNLTIDDISDHLGFSAPSGFSRAFKDWTGHAPSVYRQLRDEGRLDSDLIAAVG